MSYQLYLVLIIIWKFFLVAAEGHRYTCTCYLMPRHHPACYCPSLLATKQEVSPLLFDYMKTGVQTQQQLENVAVVFVYMKIKCFILEFYFKSFVS
jgi:hypothetical protein